MFARFLGREAPARSKEETPEDDNNQATSLVATPENNNEKSNLNLKKPSIEREPAVTELDDIDIDLLPENHSTITHSTETASSWIHSFDKTCVWPKTLTTCFPAALAGRISARSVPSRALDEKLTDATARRAAFYAKRIDALLTHNKAVRHALLVRKDLSRAEESRKASLLRNKSQAAQARREDILGQKRSCANDLVTPKSSISESDHEEVMYNNVTSSSMQKMENAVQFRNLYLKEVSRAAGKSVEHARWVAQEVQSAHEENAAFIEECMDARLARAEVRRSIVLDRRRLAAGRHGNYVKSVYLTNRYLDRRSAQMIQHQLDAATFRREVKLEEIKSNARQQNLSAQFRSCVAFRMWDAKWLNVALKTTAAQTAAKMRRDLASEQLQERLHEAALRREEVQATKRAILANQRDTVASETYEKMENATYRREIRLYERRAVIQERATIIRARKSLLSARERKAKRKELANKAEQAKMRRDAFLTSRRSACATYNWHAKIAANVQQEKLQEITATGLSQWQDRLTRAELRRQEFQEPIFAMLVSLRLKRAATVRSARTYVDKRIAERKTAFTNLRLSALGQKSINKTFERLSRVKRVQSNRQFMETFYKQVIANTTTARQRGAELRRSLYYDAIKAAATETIERSEAAVERKSWQAEESRQLLQLKLQTAEARRNDALNDKVSTALWFQGKVALARHKLASETVAKKLQLAETSEIADLRRSIEFTKGLQPAAERRLRWTQKQKQLRQEREQLRVLNDIKAQKADLRRQAVLNGKIETARLASTRVTVVRLEKRAEDVVDAAIRTAICKTMSKNAEERRAEHLEEIQCSAAFTVNHAKDVARSQKQLNAVRCELILQTSQLRIIRTSKRREGLMSQRKLGQSTIEQLQPYAGLTVIGHALPLSTSA